jgi:Reverse transcriptase (RNA-dependent DNA polymerase)
MSSLDTVRNSRHTIEKKFVISTDVELNEEARWDRKNQQEELSTEEVEVRHLVRDDGVSSSRSSEDDSSSRTGEVHLVCLLADAESISFEEAVRDPEWKAVMDKEMKTIENNETWEMTDLPKGHKPIGVKWVYKKKMTPQGTIERHKARLVVKGYRQKAGIDYNEVFALVARMEIIRLLISQAAQNEWPVHQMDVKSTFLNGVLKEEVYVEQPLGYMKLGKEHKVLRLKKALYKLKQVPRA